MFYLIVIGNDAEGKPSADAVIVTIPVVLRLIWIFQLLKILVTDPQTIGRYGLNDILRRFEFGII